MSDATELMKPEFDGGRFDDRRWFVAGYGRFYFSTKADAEAAIQLAHACAIGERRRVCQDIRDKLPD